MGKGLSPEQIVRRVREAAEPVVASFGLMLWGHRGCGGPGAQWCACMWTPPPAATLPRVATTVRTACWKALSVDQCAEISRMVGLALEVDEVFADAWVLEVSSPGMDRLFF